jgi:hypothetical protein
MHIYYISLCPLSQFHVFFLLPDLVLQLDDFGPQDGLDATDVVIETDVAEVSAEVVPAGCVPGLTDARLSCDAMDLERSYRLF